MGRYLELYNWISSGQRSRKMWVGAVSEGEIRFLGGFAAGLDACFVLQILSEQP